VSADRKSVLEALWETFSSAVSTAYDVYGWIVPALLLAFLFLGVIGLIACAVEDAPFDIEVFQGDGGIFRWTRRWWRVEQAES
jgi:hypothetical protein